MLSAVQAKLQGEAPPPPRSRLARLRRRIALGSLAGATGVALSVVGLNLMSVQDPLCAAPVLQPALSDACGSLGLGHRPTWQERLAWAALPPGDCDALRQHITAFPQGAFRSAAADRLAAAKTERQSTWQPVEHRLRLYVPRANAKPAPHQDAAKAQALDRGQAQADALCQGFAGTRSFRVSAPARIEPSGWQCTASATVTCSLEGHAVCGLEEQIVTEHEVCPD